MKHNILTLEDLLAGFRGSRIYRKATTLLGTLSVGPEADKEQLTFTADQRKQLARFAPKIQVLNVEGFGDDIWMRTAGMDWAAALVLLPGDYVPLVLEYVHGADIVLATVPSGVIETKEGVQSEEPAVRALIEAEEEGGFAIERVIPLGQGMVISARRTPERTYEFLAIPRIEQGEAVLSSRKSEDKEDIETVLVRLNDLFAWVMHPGYNQSVGLRSIVLSAMVHLGKLKPA